jgi:DNA topoisomerase-1
LNLVIVESQGKIKKIQSILGSNFKVAASFGHVCDLPKKELGYSESTLEENYLVSPDKRKTISSLRKLSSQADNVYIATDLDREGEAIAWHLIRELKLKSYFRIVFNEITEKAINFAIHNTIALDIDKVEAQRTRRVLDRMYGYKVSPVINKSIASSVYLSAGRVQSAALRLIVEKEKLINGFVSEEYYGVDALFENPDGGAWVAQWLYEDYLSHQNKSNKDIQGMVTYDDIDKLSVTDSRKDIFKDKKIASKLVDFIKENPQFTVTDIEDKKEHLKAKPCFKTSTLQQAAAVAFKWPVDKTMKVAQKLYEAGYITYMRTDSVVLSEDAIDDVRRFLSQWQKQSGESGYLPDKPNIFKNTSEDAQEAHEAIRPSKILEFGKAIEDKDERELYLLIWRRVVASQMAPAIFDCKKISLKMVESFGGMNQIFVAKGRTPVFLGWKKVAGEDMTDEKTVEAKENKEISLDAQLLPYLTVSDAVSAASGKLSIKHTKASPRFTEASLIARLESEGIGRPATYASIIKTLLNRKYVVINKRKFSATDLGVTLCEKMIDQFMFVNVPFTRNIEKMIDDILSHKTTRKSILSEQQRLLNKEISEFQKNNPTIVTKTQAIVETDIDCPTCKSNKLIIRTKKDGKSKFFSCAGYPKCKGAYSIDSNGQPVIKATVTEDSGELCPKCSKGRMIKRQAGKAFKGKSEFFFGCSNYPKCKNTQDVVQ